MYYKLKNNYILRGYKRLPCCIHNILNGKTSLIDVEEFKTLLKCDGQCDENSLFMSDEDRKNIAYLYNKGYLDYFENKQDLISDYQKYYTYNNYFLDSIRWSITGNCNYKCLHCFMDAPNFKFNEFSKHDAFKFIDQMVECGIFNVDLTGGEAMVHPDFWDIVDYLAKNNIKINTLYSNGFLVNENFFEKLKQRGIKPTISLSFDGINNWHEWLRNVKGSNKHIEDALRLSKENDFIVTTEMCVHKNNASDLLENVKYLESFGCKSIKINSLEDFGCAKAIKDIHIDDDKLFELCLDFIPKYHKENLKISVIFSTYCLLKQNKDIMLFVRDNKKINFSNYPICPFARKSMYADANGYSIPCIPYSFDEKVESSFPSLLTNNLSSILSESKYLDCVSSTCKDYLDHNNDCLKCEYFNICSFGCRGRAASLNNGNYFSKDTQCCDFFKSNKYVRLKDTIERYGK